MARPHFTFHQPLSAYPFAIPNEPLISDMPYNMCLAKLRSRTHIYCVYSHTPQRAPSHSSRASVHHADDGFHRKSPEQDWIKERHGKDLLLCVFFGFTATPCHALVDSICLSARRRQIVLRPGERSVCSERKACFKAVSS